MYEKKNLTEESLQLYNLQMHETILLKFGMWGAEDGERFHYKNDSKGAWSYVCVKIVFKFFL